MGKIEKRVHGLTLTELTKKSFKDLTHSKPPTEEELFKMVRFWDHTHHFSDEQIRATIQALKDAGEFHTVEVLIAGKGE